MSVLMVRASVKPEFVYALEEARARMFAAIERVGPKGVRYASYRLPDGVTYIAELEIADGVDNPLPAIPEFNDFQEGLSNWLAGPPTVEQLEVRAVYVG